MAKLSWERKNLSKVDLLANILPKKKVKCVSCDVDYQEKRGVARFSKRKYNGPFCIHCGGKLK
ncbi:hypothetical protein D7X33_39310, partial [Butyricicoccus sp. 1XD8-22]